MPFVTRNKQKQIIASYTCKQAGIAEEWVDEVTPDPAVLQDQVWLQVKQLREQLKHGGVKVGKKWFATDSESRTSYLGLLQLGIADGLQWKTMDNTFVTMTAALVTQIVQAIIANDTAIFANAETHREAIYASNDPATYDYLTGWPKIYGE